MPFTVLQCVNKDIIKKNKINQLNDNVNSITNDYNTDET